MLGNYLGRWGLDTDASYSVLLCSLKEDQMSYSLSRALQRSCALGFGASGLKSLRDRVKSFQILAFGLRH